MSDPLLLVTGFGAFESVARNPSGRIALALEEDPPAGCDVRGVELPVTFRGSRAAADRALADLPRAASALFSLGVHPGAGFQLERRALATLGAGRPDNDGVTGAEITPAREGDLATTFDLDLLAAALRDAGAPEVRISEDAGGYVCECIYRHILETGERLGIPALFLHVPPLEHLAVETQIPYVRAMVTELARQVRKGIASAT